MKRRPAFKTWTPGRALGCTGKTKSRYARASLGEQPSPDKSAYRHVGFPDSQLTRIPFSQDLGVYSVGERRDEGTRTDSDKSTLWLLYAVPVPDTRRDTVYQEPDRPIKN
jgi:hypothetical protein